MQPLCFYSMKHDVTTYVKIILPRVYITYFIDCSLKKKKNGHFFGDFYSVFIYIKTTK